MSGKIHIKPNLDASVEFWDAGDLHSSRTVEGPKLKLIDMHPTKPLIIAADREGKILLWDYNLKQTLLDSNVPALIIERLNVKETHAVSVPAPASYGNRLTSRSNAAMCGRIPSCASSRSTLPTSQDKLNRTPANSVSNFAPIVLNKLKQQLGAVTQVSFADISYMLSSTGFGGQTLSTFLSSRNSESLVAVLCESVLLFHDYLSRETTCIGMNELSKATATSVEMGFADTCLIGCSDGTIRVWDWGYAAGGYQPPTSCTVGGFSAGPVPKGGVVLTLPTYNKSEVLIVKTMPIRQPVTSAITPDCQMVRFISISADGLALIWEIPACRDTTGSLPPSADASGGTLLPLARLSMKDPLGPGLTRQCVSFDAETNTLLICCNEKRIRMWDMEDLHGTGIGSSMHGGGIGSSMHGGGIGSSVHGGGMSASMHGGSSTHGGSARGGGFFPGGAGAAPLKSMRLGKRGSLVAMMGGASDPLEKVMVIKSVGSVAPEKSLTTYYSKISSYAPVHHPYFTTGCYVLSAKSNSFAILQDKGSSGGGDEVSSNESGTMIGGGSDKSVPLYMVQEFSVRSLMERYFADNGSVLDALPETFRADALDANVRIYNVKPHPASPHIYAVLSSAGLLVVSLGRNPSGGMCGSHPSWGAVKFTFAHDSSVQKVLALPGQQDSAPSTQEVHPEVLEENVALELAQTAASATSSGTFISPLKRRSSTKRSGGGGDSKCSSRPVFHPSPSGDFCAVHWPESMIYTVFQTNIALATGAQEDLFGSFDRPSSASKRPMPASTTNEVDRGYCLEFGWVGTENHFLIKTPAEINPSAGGKSKRSSVTSLLFGAQKDSSVLTPPQLLLKQCVVSGGSSKGSVKVVDHTLHMGAGFKSSASGSSFRETPFFNAATVTNLFSGTLLSMNTLNAKESDAVVTAAALAKRQAEAAAAAIAAETRKGPAGPPVVADSSAEDDGSRVITDVEGTIRDVKAAYQAAPSKQVNMFYTLVSARWLKARLAQEAAAAANALAAQQAAKDKDKGKKNARKSVLVSAGAEDGAGVTEEKGVEDAVGDAMLQLIAVGPALQHADTLRWDYQRNLCALVLTGSTAVSILKLSVVASDEDGGYPQFHLQTLTSVDIGIPSSLSNAFCGLSWCEGVLFASPLSSAAVKAVFLSERQVAGNKDAGYTHHVDVYDLPYQSQYLQASSSESPLSPFNAIAAVNPIPVSEVQGLHQGTVFIAARDGSNYGISVSNHANLNVALAAQASQRALFDSDHLSDLSAQQLENAVAFVMHRDMRLDTKVSARRGQEWNCEVCMQEFVLRNWAE